MCEIRDCFVYFIEKMNIMLMYISIEGLWVKLFIWIVVNIVFFVENCKEKFYLKMFVFLELGIYKIKCKM